MRGYPIQTRSIDNHQSSAISIDLQMNLLNTWNKHQVPQYYQNIFLAHLDELQPSLAQAKIKRQIANTLQKRSYFYLLSHTDQQRSTLLRQLQPYLYIPPQHLTANELSIMCNHVKDLRHMNLVSAETILKMRQQYKCHNNEADNRQLEEYSKLIDTLEKDVDVIKGSCLKEFIPFREGFDPFLMDSYQLCHRSQTRIEQPVKKLYSMNISHAYRLIRTKDQILGLKSLNCGPQVPYGGGKGKQRRFESLPSLHNQSSYIGQLKDSRPTKIYPVTILRGKDRSSRTTHHPSRIEERLQTSYTEDYRGNLKMSKISNINNPYVKKSRAEKSKYQYSLYQQQTYSPIKKHELSANQMILEGELPNYVLKRSKKILPQQIYKEQADDDNQSDITQMKKNLNLRPIQKKPSYAFYSQPKGMVGSIKNYNPVKKQVFQIVQAHSKSGKYDFNPNQPNSLSPTKQMGQQEQKGLNYEQPIPRMMNKNIYMVNKRSFSLHPPANQHPQTSDPPKSHHMNTLVNVTKIDQSMQTQQQKITKEVQTILTKQNRAQDTQDRPKPPSNKIVVAKKQKDPNDSDQVVEDQDIIDARPISNSNSPAKPLIRVADKPPQKKQETEAAKTNRGQVKKQQKKQVKMKIGKSTIKQMQSLLQQIQIQPAYKSLFEIQKLIQWIKVNQTYLVQFHVQQECAIVALCSPIPNVGMALKLWAPISQNVDFPLSSNLFNKYIEFVQKSTTVEKILFSGDGQLFKELKLAEFTLKKQRLYERIRKTKSSKKQSQFEPFLYIECSTVNFKQSGKESMFYSEQIEQFNQQNYIIAPILEQINTTAIPEELKGLVKITEKVSNFVQVNKILEKEGFDEYEASQIKVSNVDLLRLYFNSPLKSGFVAADGLIRLYGSLLYQKDNQCLISVNTIKNNGIVFFSQNLSFESILQKSKKSSNTKIFFWAKMFSKKMYGKLVKSSPGYYGNWQINLTWQDEMQGRIKHVPGGEIVLGNNDKYTVCIQAQKKMLYGVTVDKDDFIY